MECIVLWVRVVPIIQVLGACFSDIFDPIAYPVHYLWYAGVNPRWNIRLVVGVGAGVGA